MSTTLPRPTLGGCVLVLPTATRNVPGGPPYAIDQVGQRGIVVGFDVLVPSLTLDGASIVGTATWDLWVAFINGRATALDMDEVEILFDGAPIPTYTPAADRDTIGEAGEERG